MAGERRERVRRSDGRYSGPRVNSEQVPVLPTWAVRLFLDDPRKVPYLMVWASGCDGTLSEGVQMAHYGQPPSKFDMDGGRVD
jgi:hypothetical protein